MIYVYIYIYIGTMWDYSLPPGGWGDSELCTSVLCVVCLFSREKRQGWAEVSHVALRFVAFRKDVRLPVQLQRVMAAEAEASREANAKVSWTHADN